MKKDVTFLLVSVTLLAMATVIVLTFIGSRLMQVGAPKTCRDFGSLREATAALLDGNRSLDRDRDGIPCENDFHK